MDNSSVRAGSKMNEADKLLRIKQVAELLGVSTRTVYRRIWAEELPAVKIGGLYYIRQADLEQSISSSPDPVEVVSPKIVKCGSCLKILRDADKIAQRCSHAGCLEVLCVDCLSQGKTQCRAHQSLTDRSRCANKLTSKDLSASAPARQGCGSSAISIACERAFARSDRWHTSDRTAPEHPGLGSDPEKRGRARRSLAPERQSDARLARNGRTTAERLAAIPLQARQRGTGQPVDH